MKRKSLMLAMVLGLFILLTEVSYAGCTLGVKDCRPSGTPGTCYWWVCETCGSETCWIFKGTQCTCPRSELDVPNLMLAQTGVYASCESKGVNAEKLMQDIKTCVQEARIRDPGYTAYLNPERCTIPSFGSTGNWNAFWRAEEEFWACMRQYGWKKD